MRLCSLMKWLVVFMVFGIVLDDEVHESLNFVVEYVYVYICTYFFTVFYEFEKPCENLYRIV